MDSLLFARQKINQIKNEISRVRTSDFHHAGVKQMLDTIDGVFGDLLHDINHVSPSASSDVVNDYILSVNVSINHFHDVIGIILRSTNPRNSFEVYDPMLRLAKRLLGTDTTLVLSSEWGFVPFANPSVFAGLPNCVVVGLPVMEAANALVTPLAGHELGHAVWQAKKLSEETAEGRENALREVFLKRWEKFRHYTEVDSKDIMESRLKTYEWGLIPLAALEKVCQEVFCDMLGVRIFGMGYLYAFEYLAAPSLGKTDLQEYPTLDARARYLADAMERVVEAEQNDRGRGTTKDAPAANGWPRLAGYAERFSKEARSDLEDYEKFLLDSAHQACGSLVPQLRDRAAEVCGADGEPLKVPRPTLSGATTALGRFETGLPAVADLADLVNAGWLRYLDPSFWSDVPPWESGQFRLLNELVFKSLDVTEFMRRLEDAPKDR